MALICFRPRAEFEVPDAFFRLVLPLSVFLLPLIAQEEATSTETWSLDETMVVTAQYEPVSARGSVFQVDVITRGEIENRSAASLGELLSHRLGFKLDQDGVFGAAPTVRGLSGENVKILIDGVPVVGRLNGIIDLNHLMLDGIERVEIIEGPASVYYGTDALAGVINLISASASSQGQVFTLHTRRDSVGDWVAAPRYSWFNGNHSLAVGLTGKRFDGHDEDPNTAEMEFNAREEAQADLSYTRHGQNWDLGYQGRFFNELLEEPDTNRAGMLEQTDYATRRTTHKFFLNRMGSRDRSPQFSLSRSDYRRDLEEPGSLDRTRFHQWQARAVISDSSKQVGWQLGLTADLEEGTGSRLLGGKQEADEWAIFGSLRFHLGKHFTLQPSLRATQNSNYSVPLTPSLHAVWNNPNKGEWRASLSRGYRGPSLKQLYLDFNMAAGPFTYLIHGNPQLKAEDGNHLNLSHVRRHMQGGNQWRFQGELFYNDIENLITLGSLIPDPNRTNHFTRGYLNINQHRTYGGEFELSLRRGPFSGSLGVTQTYAYNVLSDAETVPDYHDRLDFSMNMELTTQWVDLSLFYRGVGKHKSYFIPRGATEPHGEQVEAYQLMDIKAGRTIGEVLELGVGARNLLDVESLDTLDTTLGQAHGNTLVGWGRTWFLDARLRWNW